MAKAEKYRYSFKSHEGQTCVVRFEFEGFTGSSTTLVGAARPFVLKEFNTDDDIYKPIRPQMAEMSFIASDSGVSIDDFLMNNDDDVIVYFDFGSWTNYWMGYMLQDDFQETWIDTSHIITLRATEGIGQLKDVELTDAGTELAGRYTPLEIIQFAMDQSVQGFDDYRVFSNLFHSSMNDTSTNTGLDQCYVDAKTFMINPSEYDNSYDALEKVNKAWNQAIYMYYGKWVIFRMEELYIPFSSNFRGYRNVGGTRTAINTRYDAEVGVQETIKPITPEMLRFIQRRTKSDTIQFNFEQFDEVVCNGSFSRGALVSSTSTLKTYQLDLWSWYEGTPGSPTTPTSGSYGRKETFDANAKLDDQFAFQTQKATSGNRWLISCGIDVLKNETFSFSIDNKFKETFAGTATLFTVSFQLVTATNYYTLDDNGVWYTSNASWTTNYKVLQTYYNGTGSPVPTDWVTSQVEAQSIPDDGMLYILLWCPGTPNVANQEKWFKNLQLDMVTKFNGINIETINAVKSIFTKSDTIKPKFYDEIAFDDGLSKLYKGSLYEDDQQTLTTAEWHRYRYPSEVEGFRKQNDITHWSHNRFNRNKIDANFYGLTWSGGTQPLGLINTIKFVDDDPNKVYAIANLKEMDFSSSTWSATLVEVYDMLEDNAYGVDSDYAGIYTTQALLPQTLIQGAEFSIQSTTRLRYDGVATITVDITWNMIGVISAIASPFTLNMTLNKNGTIISDYDVYVTAIPDNVNFSVTVTGVTLATNDYLEIQIPEEDIDTFTLNKGKILFGYASPNPPTYDSYEDKFIYK